MAKWQQQKKEEEIMAWRRGHQWRRGGAHQQRKWPAMTKAAGGRHQRGGRQLLWHLGGVVAERQYSISGGDSVA